MRWVVYILFCSDGSLYTGCTNNLKKRIAAHNNGTGAKYTYPRRPVSLAYSTNVYTRSDALKLEAKIKRMSRKQKLELVSTGK